MMIECIFMNAVEICGDFDSVKFVKISTVHANWHRWDSFFDTLIMLINDTAMLTFGIVPSSYFSCWR